jgi:RNA polymerase sigma-70 factor (ECF subfamily)
MSKHLNSIGMLSEKEIIDKIINGEIALFEVLIRRYDSVLYKIARGYGFNHQDAQDLMQETHLTAYTEIKGFGHRSSYKTWLSKIMINKCLYNLSHGYFKKEQPASKLIDEHAQSMHAKQINNTSEKQLVNKELAKVIENSLLQIPLNYRTVFILREIEGFNVAETAELLNITLVNVRVRLNRAKGMLQKQLEQFYPLSDIYELNLVYCNDMVNNVFTKIQKPFLGT